MTAPFQGACLGSNPGQRIRLRWTVTNKVSLPASAFIIMKPLSQQLFDYVNSHRKHLLLLFAVLLLLFFFFNELKAMAVVSFLALLGAFGQFYKRYIRFTSAIEFVTFGTVIVSVAYGAVAGMLFALAVSFAAEVISGNIDAFIVIYLPVRVLSGLFAAVVPFSSILAVGISTTSFINLLSQPIYLLQGDAEIRLEGISYLCINIPFNILLFKLLGSSVLGIAI